MKMIVGYFGNYEKAEAVVGELAARCFGPDCIQIGRATEGKRMEEENEEASPRVRGYYPAEEHAESAFVAVSASENDAMAVSHIMGHHGAFYVEERPVGPLHGLQIEAIG